MLTAQTRRAARILAVLSFFAASEWVSATAAALQRSSICHLSPSVPQSVLFAASKAVTSAALYARREVAALAESSSPAALFAKAQSA